MALRHDFVTSCDPFGSLSVKSDAVSWSLKLQQCPAEFHCLSGKDFTSKPLLGFLPVHDEDKWYRHKNVYVYPYVTPDEFNQSH